jgi:hypothetical protein
MTREDLPWTNPIVEQLASGIPGDFYDPKFASMIKRVCRASKLSRLGNSFLECLAGGSDLVRQQDENTSNDVTMLIRGEYRQCFWFHRSPAMFVCGAVRYGYAWGCPLAI